APGRTVRRPLRGSDLLRLQGGARARHRSVVRRWRRRIVGGLRAPPRGAVGIVGAPPAWRRRLAGWPRRRTSAAGHQGGPVAAASVAVAGGGLRPQARL